MGRSIALGFYLLVANRMVGYANRKLARRLEVGKEDPDRVDERRGIAGIPRPNGPLIWFHAASVGESLSLLDLITRVREDDPGVSILMTSGTRTSADLLKKRMPEGVIHQFAPLDAGPFVRAFLGHWKPDLAIWTESELWPSMIHETHKSGAQMILLNARMSLSSFKSWRWARAMAGSLLDRFQMILTQDEMTKRRLIGLGADIQKIQVNGSLKQSSGALPYNEIDRNEIAERLGSRSVWLAASTHAGEEEIAAQAHRIARGTSHRLMLIIAPRHPERGPEIAAMLRDDGWRVDLRSESVDPSSDTDIYVADTLGEMGLWYRLAPVSFVGGSLVDIGGHNPFEPAALGSAIVHGPHVSNAQETYEVLADAGATRQVQNSDELADAVVELLEPQKAALMAHAAWEVSSSGAQASDNALNIIQAILDERV
ncbi:MAG: 3-deoxy-D-manno-octulosonic acid transferase [Litoreibacter sp.]